MFDTLSEDLKYCLYNAYVELIHPSCPTDLSKTQFAKIQKEFYSSFPQILDARKDYRSSFLNPMLKDLSEAYIELLDSNCPENLMLTKYVQYLWKYNGNDGYEDYFTIKTQQRKELAEDIRNNGQLRPIDLILDVEGKLKLRSGNNRVAILLALDRPIWGRIVVDRSKT